MVFLMGNQMVGHSVSDYAEVKELGYSKASPKVMQMDVLKETQSDVMMASSTAAMLESC